jgi:hypothetical protein
MLSLVGLPGGHRWVCCFWPAGRAGRKDKDFAEVGGSP